MPLKSYTQAEMFLTERRRLELPLLAMIWLGVTSVSLAQADYFYVLFGTFAVAINLLAVLRTKELYVARVIVNIAVIGATAVLLLEFVAYSTSVIGALGHYIILIQLCKLFERKTNRDYAQMIVLSILLMIAGAVNGSHMLFAAAMIIEIALICYVTMIMTLKRGLDRVAATQLTTASSTTAVRHVAWNVIRDWPGHALRVRLWKMLPIMLIVGVLAFLAAPRDSSSNSASSARGDGASAITGMGENVQLGRARKIYQSDEIAMQVAFRYANAPNGMATSQPTTAPASRPQPPFYMRGIAYDTYSQRIHSSWNRGRQRFQTTTTFSSPPAEVLQDTVVQDVQMSSTLPPFVFACDAFVGMEPQTLCRIDRNLNIEMFPTQTGDNLSQYTAYSLPLDAQKKHALFLDALHKEMGEDTSQADQEITLPQRVFDLANEWCADLPRTPPDSPAPDGWELAVANRISARLQERCSYTLDLSDVDPAQDPFEDFLFNTRKGNCEYFASTLVAMCRSRGIKARLATGFRVDAAARNSDVFGDVYIVRGRDAHAWVEVRTGNFWTIVDPTPGGEPEPTKDSWWNAVQKWYENIRASWDKNVAGFNAQSRENFWQWFAGAIYAIWSAIKSAWAAVGNSFNNFLVEGHVDAVMFALIGLVSAVTLLAEAFLFAGLLRKIRANKRAAADLVLAAHGKVQFILKFFAMLERMGLPSQPCRTMRESAQLAADHFRLPRDVVLKLVELYYRLRWGHQPPEPAEIAAAAQTAEQLKAMLPK